MLGNDYQTASKQKNHLTNHKSNFSFISPTADPQTVVKQVLMQSRNLDYLRNRTQLFTEIKQNSNLISLVSKSYSKDFVEQMKNEQRVQVEKLLLEISRLHDMLEDQQRAHKHTMNRLKEESEHISLLRISSLKQSQLSQVQILEHQLKKTRDALEERCLLFEDLERTSSRKIESLSHQNQGLKINLKDFVERKNNEIYQLRSQYNKETESISLKQKQQNEELKDLADKQLKKVLKRLEQKQIAFDNLKMESQQTQNTKINIIQMFQKQKLQMQQQLETMLNQQRTKQAEIIHNLKQFYHSEAEQMQENTKQQKQMIDLELQQLFNIIKIKDKEVQKNMIFRESEKFQHLLQAKQIEQQNDHLKRLILQLKTQHLQQIELFKSKISLLHQSDIEALVRMYQAKIQLLAKEVQNVENENKKVNQSILNERNEFYQKKKKFDYTISTLHEQILQLKYGMTHFEKDMKDKLQNQRSMMMLTSRNFIKQNEAKANNIRFYEEELRKLRQLLELQAQEVEQSQRNVEQKIKLAEDQLIRLSNKILQVKREAQETENKLKQTIEEKAMQIRRLNNILNSRSQNNIVIDQKEEIRKLDEEILKKEQERKNILSKAETIQLQMNLLKAENERLLMETQMNAEDAKKEYKSISDKNLSDFKAFYDRRLQEIENEKKQLQKINSSQSQQITELIKKYRELEFGMKELLKQTKKRGDLQSRIMGLGMDNNLVKNMSQLFMK